MRSHLVALVLVFALAACGSAQVHPITPPAEGPQSAFAPLVACAGEEGLRAIRHPDSVNVDVEGTWVQFMDQENGFNMVIVNAPDAAAADRAKKRGDALYACANARLAAASNPDPATSSGPGHGGFGEAMGEAMGAIGNGLAVMAYCTQETACRTHLLMVVCKAIADESCRNSVNDAQDPSTDPEGCRRSIAQMVVAAQRYAPPGWLAPPECQH